jgi:hypothetical protein
MELLRPGASGVSASSVALRPIGPDDEPFLRQVNRARRLYERLGFSIVGDEGVYWALEWTPAHVR